MSSTGDSFNTEKGPGTPAEELIAPKKEQNDVTKPVVSGKPVTDKGNKTSNMTVETETVDTSSINILPINHDLVPKGLTHKENVIDDSNETFLYDNSAQGQHAAAQTSLAISQQPSQAQMALNMHSQGLLSGSSAGSTAQGNSSVNGSINNGATNSSSNPGASPTFLNGHTMKSSANMKKPRFTQRNGSFHSINAQGLTMIPSADCDTAQTPGIVMNASHRNGAGGSFSHNSTNESSTDLTLNNTNNNHTNNTHNALLGKYSDNEDDDEDDFDSSTYDTRSQVSNTNRSNISPRASKHQANRRVASMKPLQSKNWAQNVKNKPFNTLPHTTADEVPALRTITSKLFDSKGSQPRRYSGLPQDIDFDDFDDDDLDDYGYDYHNTRFGDEEADIENGEYRNLKYGGKKNNYGSTNADGHRSSSTGRNGFGLNRLKKVKRNNDLYYSPHDFPISKGLRWRQFSSFCYTFLLIIALLFLGFISGFLLASTKDLQGVHIVDATEIIISQEELVFNMVVDGFNPGFINIEVNDVEIEIFAKSSHVHDGDFYKISSNDGVFETVLLGSITQLEIPLKFQGGFFTRQKNIAVTEIKIVNPCAGDSDPEPSSTSTTSTVKPTSTSTSTSSTTTTTSEANNAIDPVKMLKDKEEEPTPDQEKWHNISQHPFDLIIRGVLKYNLPILNEYKTVGINKVIMVDPDNLNL